MRAWLFLHRACFLVVFSFQVLQAAPGGLEFSDPANLPPPPRHAIGFPSREANFDVLPGFVKPPAGYGEVAFFWWLGDPLTKERLTYHLDQLAEKGVMGLQVNYAHSDKGGRSYGLTYRSEPPLFSEEWWKLFQWFVVECRKRGMAASLSDYTLCAPGQGWFTDEVIQENPAVAGSVLRSTTKDVTGGKTVTWDVPEGTLSLTAYRKRDGAAVETGSGLDLRTRLKEQKLTWEVPGGNWMLVAVSRQKMPLSIDPMNALSGKKYIEKFFQRFEDRIPGEGGKGLNFFFSDELDLGIGGKMWTDGFQEEFRKRKGYDLMPELAALFVDIGPRTPKIRMDYADVLVCLSEENFFRPVFDWHYQRGMIYGCDHGGRGKSVTEFGDYFRTQRWMTGPGNDSPGFGSPDIIKNKVNASIAHLYQRPRVWLEGFHSSGWGSSTEGLVATHMKNYMAGSTLLTLHGLYYSTHGGFWEWAPPCNHWRMPYWEHMGEYLRCSERLSYLLSQGVHRCDVAILYPVAPVEAGMRGSEAVDAAFAAGGQLFSKGIDFDYIDFESLARARIEQQELRVSGEAYKVLVLPAMAAVRHSTLEKALEFYRGGGKVVALKALPEASDRVGRDKPEVNKMVKELFGVTAAEADPGEKAMVQQNAQGGVGLALLGKSLSKAPRKYDGGFEGRWVWSAETQPKVYFKAVWPGDANTRRTYQLKLLCDNSATLFINGKEAVRCNDYTTGWTGAVELTGGDVITIDAVDQDNGRSSAGLFVAVLADGKTKLSAEDFRYSVSAPSGNWRTSAQLAGLRKPDTGNVHPFHLGTGSGAGEGLSEVIARHIQRDFISDANATVLHRKVGPRDVYMVYGAPKNSECVFRATGKVELWDPWTGKTSPLYAVAEQAGRTKVRMPLTATEVQLIVFNPGAQEYALEQTDLDEVAQISEKNGQLVVEGFATSQGAKTARIQHDNKIVTLRGQVDVQPAVLPLDGLWDFELKPTLDNRWGDFRMPASDSLIGPEARFFRYTDAANAGWAQLESAKWKRVSCSFGPKFWKLGPLLEKADLSAMESSLLRLENIDPAIPVVINGQTYSWQPYEFSWRWGVEGDPGHQGYHGLKEKVSDDFIVLGRTRGGATQNSYEPEAPGTRYYLWSSLRAERQADVRLLVGGNKPKLVAINGGRINDLAGTVRLKAGANPLLLRYDSVGRGHFVAEYADAPNAPERYPLSMNWYTRPGVVPFDIQGDKEPPVGCYHFVSPPGVRGMTIVARGEVQAQVNGKEIRLEPGAQRIEGREYKVKLERPEALAAQVLLKIKQERGCYGGAALPEPVAFDCGAGQMAPGDWSKMGALEAYSGGASYRKKVTLRPEQTRGKVVLDLGSVVSSAEVRVNGKRAGIRLAPPWTVDITDSVQPGENEIEILVYNTLSNHYSSIPTRYRGSLTSGLLGPIRIETMAKVELR